MKGFTLCFVYLLIAVCNVHSASYYYRAGREVVPVAEELLVAEETRREDPLIALETYEVVPAELMDPAQKLATVAETVKTAAVEAVRTKNEETVSAIENVKPFETVVENVEPAVKTDAVVPVVHLNEPNVNAVQEVIEEVKAVPVEPVESPNVRQNPLEAIGAQIQTAVQNIQNQFGNFPIIGNLVRPQTQQAAQVSQAQEAAAAVQQADPLASASTDPSQSADSASPISLASSTPLPNLFQNAFNSITNLLPSATTVKPQLANSVSPVAAGSTQVSPVTPPNLIQNALQSITNFLQRSTTTAAPITESVPAAVSGTKDGDDNVIVQHYVDVDSKIDEDPKKKHQSTN